MSGDRSDLLARINQLEKALDTACQELEDFDMTFNNDDFEDVKTKT